jgi:hypothetical protein
LKDQFLAFIAERFPFAVGAAAEAFARVAGKKAATTPDAVEALAAPVAKALRDSVAAGVPSTRAETTPGVTAATRLAQAGDEIADAVTGFFRRAAIAASLTADERREILRGMLLTRAIDNRLKLFFTGSEVRHGSTPFQGKGFRSLGQEAIYAAVIRLHRGA